MQLSMQSFGVKLAICLLTTLILAECDRQAFAAPPAHAAPLTLLQNEHDRLFVPWMQQGAALDGTRTPEPPDQTLSPPAATLLALINAERSRAGCRELALHPTLVGVAQEHSEDARLIVRHRGSDGALAGERLQRNGYPDSYWGELLATVSGDNPGPLAPSAAMAATVMSRWLGDATSPEALKLRTCEFTAIGIGVAVYVDAIYYPRVNWVVVLTGPSPYADLEQQDAAITIDRTDQAAVAAAYRESYLPTLTVASGWRGEHERCDAGTLSSAYLEAIRTQINYFRAMAGVPAHIVFDDEYNRRAQAAALIMSVNNLLTHEPAPTLRCYSEAGRMGATSNLVRADGQAAPFAPIAYFMEDAGDGNVAVGHRRHLLGYAQRTLGAGTVEASSEEPPASWAHATYVLDEKMIAWLRLARSGQESQGLQLPPSFDSFVSWPPAGYVPAPLVYPRWSIQHPSADFSAAQVQVTVNGAPVEIAVEYATPLAERFLLPNPALVWSPKLDWARFDWTQDPRIEVTITGILIDGAHTTVTYTVHPFSPD